MTDDAIPDTFIGQKAVARYWSISSTTVSITAVYSSPCIFDTSDKLDCFILY